MTQTVEKKPLPDYVIEKYCDCVPLTVERPDGTVAVMGTDKSMCRLHSESKEFDLPDGVM